MGALSNRVGKLEQSIGDTLIVIIEDADALICAVPTISQAYVGSRVIHREQGESQQAFLARINPRRRPITILEADCEFL